MCTIDCTVPCWGCWEPPVRPWGCTIECTIPCWGYWDSCASLRVYYWMYHTLLRLLRLLCVPEGVLLNVPYLVEGIETPVWPWGHTIDCTVPCWWCWQPPVWPSGCTIDCTVPYWGCWGSPVQLWGCTTDYTVPCWGCWEPPVQPWGRARPSPGPSRSPAASCRPPP